MAKRLTVWRVRTSDENYSGNNNTWLVAGNTAAEAESKAIKCAKTRDEAGRDEKSLKPYVTNIELIGTLD